MYVNVNVNSLVYGTKRGNLFYMLLLKFDKIQQFAITPF